jgi:hypothetical protein
MRLPSPGAANWPGGFGNGRPLVSHDLVTGLHTRILRPLRQAPARLGLATEFFSLRHGGTTRIVGFGSPGAPHGIGGRPRDAYRESGSGFDAVDGSSTGT